MPLAIDDVGRTMPGHAEEQVERLLAAVVEHGDAASRVDRRRPDAPGTNSMPRSANAASSASEVSGEGGTGVPNGMHERDLAGVANAARRQVVVEQQGCLARARAGT